MRFVEHAFATIFASEETKICGCIEVACNLTVAGIGQTNPCPDGLSSGGNNMHEASSLRKTATGGNPARDDGET